MGLITLRSLLLAARDGGRTEVDDTDAAIMRATLVCLGRNGTSRMSMADIAAEAGVGRATVFRRFETKNDLLRCAFAWELENFLREFHVATRTMSDPAERTAEWFVQAIRIVRTHPVARRIVADGNALAIMSDPQVTTMLLQAIDTQLRLTVDSVRTDVDLRTASELVARFFVSTWLVPDLGDATATDEGVRRIAASMLAFLLYQPSRLPDVS
jgi:AcrR family transcriptional regulator